jgi:alpha-glucosidase
MTEWWRGAVVYQVYPRSFADSNGDGVGDLPGLLARLDHVASLGVDAIWISPFFRSPMRDFGYDVSDFRDVDPVFGTLADFDAIVARSHALGLKVLIDQIYSHTSDQHAWFAESRASRTNPRADWYVWADAKPDGSPPNNWQSIFAGPAWTWDARRQQYYLHNFLVEQPDLNLLNPDVQTAVLEDAKFWLDRGVDGLRVDAVCHFTHDPLLRDNPPREGGKRTRPVDFQALTYNSDRPETFAFLERLRALLDRYDGRVSIGEIGGPDAAERSVGPYLDGARLHTAYSFRFLLSGAPTPAGVRAAMDEWERSYGNGWPTWVFSNHDAPRAPTRWGGEHAPPEFAKQLNALLLSLRGSVCLYQGEELGLPQAHVPFDRLRDPEAIANWPRTLGRDGARTPMPWLADEPHAGFSTIEPWLPIDWRHHGLAVDRQAEDGGSVLACTRELLALRRRSRALRAGTMGFLEVGDEVLVHERHGPAASGGAAERVVCAFNFGGRAARIELPPGRWRVLAASALASCDDRATNGDLEGALQLGRYGFAMLEPSS